MDDRNSEASDAEAYTADVDFSVLVDAGDEARVAEALLARLPARVENAAEFASRSRVVLARSESGVGIDIVLAGLPFGVG